MKTNNSLSDVSPKQNNSCLPSFCHSDNSSSNLNNICPALLQSDRSSIFNNINILLQQQQQYQQQQILHHQIHQQQQNAMQNQKIKINVQSKYNENNNLDFANKLNVNLTTLSPADTTSNCSINSPIDVPISSEQKIDMIGSPLDSLISNSSNSQSSSSNCIKIASGSIQGLSSPNSFNNTLLSLVSSPIDFKSSSNSSSVSTSLANVSTGTSINSCTPTFVPNKTTNNKNVINIKSKCNTNNLYEDNCQLPKKRKRKENNAPLNMTSKQIRKERKNKQILLNNFNNLDQLNLDMDESNNSSQFENSQMMPVESSSSNNQKSKQRAAANERERKRMFNLNQAFQCLRDKVPKPLDRRLSKIETIQLAITYIHILHEQVAK